MSGCSVVNIVHDSAWLLLNFSHLVGHIATFIWSKDYYKQASMSFLNSTEWPHEVKNSIRVLGHDFKRSLGR